MPVASLLLNRTVSTCSAWRERQRLPSCCGAGGRAPARPTAQWRHCACPQPEWQNLGRPVEKMLKPSPESFPCHQRLWLKRQDRKTGNLLQWRSSGIGAFLQTRGLTRLRLNCRTSTPKPSTSFSETIHWISDLTVHTLLILGLRTSVRCQAASPWKCCCRKRASD